MKTIRYCVLAAMSVLVGLAFWAFVRADAHANGGDSQQAGCNCSQKSAIPQDPKERAEFDRAYFAAMADEQAERSKRDAVERLRWVGCKVTCSAKSGDQDFERKQSLVGLLMAKHPMPKQREAKYDWALARPGTHLVGWDLTISNVTEVKDGEILELLVLPKLVSDWAITMVNYACKETWKLDLNGNLVFQDIQDIEPAGGLKLLIGQ